MMDNFQQLDAYVKDIFALSYLQEIAHWDSSTHLPRKALEQRVTSVGALQSEIHNRKTSPQLSELLSKIEEVDLTSAQIAQVREIRKLHNRAIKIPQNLSRELAEATGRAEVKWEIARKAKSFKEFLPELKLVVKLKREEGALLSNNGNIYDALLDEYELGMSQEFLDRLFGKLRTRLISLMNAIFEKGDQIPQLKGKFGKKKQIKLAKKLSKMFGYNLKNGNLHLVVHPFCCGTGQDIRITTRVDINDPFNCIYSTIHESGHGAYEQNVCKDFTLTAIGGGTSLGVHESQSRICENQLARSKHFSKWLFKEFRYRFKKFGIHNEWDFYCCINQLRKGYIRTEADEIQYNLHIILRYELEKELISGSLEVEDLEEAWNKKFKSSFGYEVPSADLGVLQDVHWSCGLFGYFPTYTLGNVYAAILYNAIQKDHPNLNKELAKGNPSVANKWLKANVHQFGALKNPTDTIQDASGEEISVEPLLNYLEEKFAEIYQL